MGVTFPSPAGAVTCISSAQLFVPSVRRMGRARLGIDWVSVAVTQSCVRIYSPCPSARGLGGSNGRGGTAPGRNGQAQGHLLPPFGGLEGQRLMPVPSTYGPLCLFQKLRSQDWVILMQLVGSGLEPTSTLVNKYVFTQAHRGHLQQDGLSQREVRALLEGGR